MNISQTLGITPPVASVYPSTKPCANPELIIGLELETENCITMTTTGYQKLCAKTNFRTETDGSLRGVAYEFISLPMQSQHALAALDDFFGATKFTQENYTDRCSVHVHVNCTDMTLQQVSNVALLYTIVEDILFEFVGADRDTNIYCIPWNQCRQHLNLVNTFLHDPTYVMRGWNKYTALNLIPLRTQGTVEFRQMHGTSDMGKLTTWINLIGSIFKYAKEIELNNLITQIKELNSNSQYEQFFSTVLGGYLPYNEVYSQKLEEGVIFAKYSLMSYKEGKKSAETHITFDELANIPAAPARPGIEAWIRVPNNLWTTEGQTVAAPEFMRAFPTTATTGQVERQREGRSRVMQDVRLAQERAARQAVRDLRRMHDAQVIVHNEPVLPETDFNEEII